MIYVGWGCRRPLLGIEGERLVNGFLFRVSLWPNRWGFHVRVWRPV